MKRSKSNRISTAAILAVLMITSCRSAEDIPLEVDSDIKPMTDPLTRSPTYSAYKIEEETDIPLTEIAETKSEEAPVEAAAEVWMPAESDVEYIAKTIYGEALIVKSDTRRAAVAWCILNRVDSKGYPDTIEDVVTEPYQFSGYDPDHPVIPELRSLAIDVLQRWNAEKNGEDASGRVLPKLYTFFVGDFRENYFSTNWQGTDYYDWSLPSPYES